MWCWVTGCGDSGFDEDEMREEMHIETKVNLLFACLVYRSLIGGIKVDDQL